jgi:hypothetical protein
LKSRPQNVAGAERGLAVAGSRGHPHKLPAAPRPKAAASKRAPQAASGQRSDAHFAVMSGTGRTVRCLPSVRGSAPGHLMQEPGQRQGGHMSDMQFLFLLVADELRTRAKEILVRAANTNDRELRRIMHVVAAGYEKLARQAEQRVREAA